MGRSTESVVLIVEQATSERASQSAADSTELYPRCSEDFADGFVLPLGQTSLPVTILFTPWIAKTSLSRDLHAGNVTKLPSKEGTDWISGDGLLIVLIGIFWYDWEQNGKKSWGRATMELITCWGAPGYRTEATQEKAWWQLNERMIKNIMLLDSMIRKRISMRA